VKVIGLLRSKETRTIEVDAATYLEGKAALEQQIPEGWELQHIRSEKDG